MKSTTITTETMQIVVMDGGDCQTHLVWFRSMRHSGWFSIGQAHFEAGWETPPVLTGHEPKRAYWKHFKIGETRGKRINTILGLS